MLSFDTNLGLDTFPYPTYNYQLATEHYDVTSEASTNAKASHANPGNLNWTLEPAHKVGDKVLLSTNNIYIKIVLPKMKPPRTGPFIILSPN